MLTNAPFIPTLAAQDLERAKKFYEEQLGLQSVPAAVGALFKVGAGSNLWLYQKGPEQIDLAVGHFIVSNLEQEMKKLRDQGIVFEEYDLPNGKTKAGIGTVGPLKFAWFRDSEGNLLNLMEVPQRSARKS